MTEFSHSQEAKLAEAQQKAMLKGETFPDVPIYNAVIHSVRLLVVVVDKSLS